MSPPSTSLLQLTITKSPTSYLSKLLIISLPFSTRTTSPTNSPRVTLTANTCQYLSSPFSSLSNFSSTTSTTSPSKVFISSSPLLATLCAFTPLPTPSNIKPATTSPSNILFFLFIFLSHQTNTLITLNT